MSSAPVATFRLSKVRELTEEERQQLTMLVNAARSGTQYLDNQPAWATWHRLMCHAHTPVLIASLGTMDQAVFAGMREATGAEIQRRLTAETVATMEHLDQTGRWVNRIVGAATLVGVALAVSQALGWF